jgi:dTDP-glucose 4,6-dehydratase
MSETVFAVIGSNCFTGSHVVDQLLSDPNNSVIGLSRSPEKHSMFLPYKRYSPNKFKFFQVDLIREATQLMSLLDEFQPSIVINVAALSEVGLSNFKPVEYFDTNTTGVVKLCNELRTRDYLKQYIHISSAEVYGSCPNPLLESAPLNPSTPYAVSKASADMFLLTLQKNFGFPVSLIRSTNVYGRHQQLFKIIPRTMIYIKERKKLELHGGGKAVKTWIHIRDVVQGIIRVARNKKSGQIYHFSDVHSYTIRDLVKMICDRMGANFNSVTVMVNERLGQDARYELDYSKAQRELDWSNQVSFQQGLDETIKWINENWEQIQNESQVYIHQT